ncbi:MAG: NAD(P)H-binding protein, partial [Actinomycetota bacterium]|nr:NAD(P)H-binding protein [Actinomycetota bacterium]
MILVTGASGSIGSRLVDRLVEVGYTPRIAGRQPERLTARWPQLSAVELDVGRPATLAAALDGIEAAYYLVHSMEPGTDGGFRERDAQGARNFARAAMEAGVQRVIYLGGLGRDDQDLSEHLASRQETGRILAEEGPQVLELRAAMVIGSDSASYRMLTDLVNRLPAMILPRWV